jgi:hypothetical protein
MLRRVTLIVMLLLASATESRKGHGRRARARLDQAEQAAAANELAGVINPCSTAGQAGCCGDGACDRGAGESEINCMADCPGVTTHETCGEEPHSDRGGKGRTFGVSFRASSAQDCCDKCKAHKKGCNSWTFCGYPVCFGLDTGWNHSYGECWLRELADASQPTFGQRGKYSMRYRTRMLRTRKSCTSVETPGGQSAGWACPPTHVPWTSGSVGVKADLTTKWQTGGGWGNMRIHRLDTSGAPIEASCTRNAGQPCDPTKLDHGR